MCRIFLCVYIFKKASFKHICIFGLMIAGKRILICPLNWGLGHATRCIPIIRAMLEEGFQPVIAASGRPMHLLKKVFPDLEFILFPDYDIQYGKYMVVSMMRQFPVLLSRIRKEHKRLDQLIELHRIDAVFSDNRFGLYTDKVPCVYMTHQLSIQAPVGQRILFLLHRWLIRKYDACWVPDVKGVPNLSGKLSHGLPLDEQVIFIGSLSRFHIDQKKEVENGRLLIILSGPEPQRSLLEEKLLEESKAHQGNVVLVRGITESNEVQKTKHVSMFDSLDEQTLQEEIEKAEWIVSRPGYSSMMDYSCFNKKLILIPTPGQTEQEYLASYYQENNRVVCMDQENIELKKALIESNKVGHFRYDSSNNRDWKKLFGFFQSKRKG